MMATDTHRTVDAVFRIEHAKLIDWPCAHGARDVGLAEELAQDALVAALEQWPNAGIPDKPGALYDALAELTPSPVVQLNRAVTLAMLSGPAAGLEPIDEFTLKPALTPYTNPLSG